MPVLQVYGDAISGNCLKVKWTLERLGRPFEWIETGVLDGSTRTPAFLAMNPAGQVPAIVLEDGRPLAQSNAILLYLAEGSELIPTDAYDRARMLEWLFWEQYSHEPAIAVARFQVRYLGKAPSDLDPKLYERCDAALARLELTLNGPPFLVGQSLSLADISLVAYTRMAADARIDLTPWPAVRAWIVRVERELGLGPY